MSIRHNLAGRLITHPTRRQRLLALERLECRTQPGALLPPLDADLVPESDADETSELGSEMENSKGTGGESTATDTVFASPQISNESPVVSAMGSGNNGGGNNGGGGKPTTATKDFSSADHLGGAVIGGPYSDVMMRDAQTPEQMVTDSNEHDLLNVTGTMTLQLPSVIDGGGMFACGTATHKFVADVYAERDNTIVIPGGGGDMYNMNSTDLPNPNGSARLWDCTTTTGKGKAKQVVTWLVEWPNANYPGLGGNTDIGVTIERVYGPDDPNERSVWTFKTNLDGATPNAFFTKIVNGTNNFYYHDSSTGAVTSCEVAAPWHRVCTDGTTPDSNASLLPAPIDLIATES